MIGNLHLTAAGAADSWKRRKTFHESANLTSATSSQCSTVIDSLRTAAEANGGKRGKKFKVRLHAAKYLLCDKLLKDLFFPLQRFKGQFGFVINSGYNTQNAAAGATNGLGSKASRGSYRGLAFMKLRHTWPRYLSDYPTQGFTNSTGAGDYWEQNAKLLNGRRIKIATSDVGGSAKTIMSYFRRFNVDPVKEQRNDTGGGGSPDTHEDTGSAGALKKVTSLGVGLNSTRYRQLPLDWNCSDMESQALAAMPFIPNPYTINSFSSGSEGNDSGFNMNPQQWLGGPFSSTVGPTTYFSTQPTIYNQSTATNSKLVVAKAVAATVMRIADGKVTLDLQNGSRTPCVAEVVIHSMKKCEEDIGTTQLYDAILKAGNYQHSVKSPYPKFGVNNVSGSDGQPAYYHYGDLDDNVGSGLDAFFDPKTPLLSVKGPQKKYVDEIANEVHRSAHVLAPGESKLLEISLGSLYYKIGDRCSIPSINLNSDGVENEKSDNVCKHDGAGTLAVCIGTSGFDALEVIAGDGDTLTWSTHQAAVTTGAGFWAGKTPAPSTVVVAGQYEEAFYPAYLESTHGFIGNVPTGPNPSYAYSGNDNNSKGLPLANIAPEVVSTVESSDYYTSVGGGKAPSAGQGSI